MTRNTVEHVTNSNTVKHVVSVPHLHSGIRRSEGYLSSHGYHHLQAGSIKEAFIMVPKAHKGIVLVCKVHASGRRSFRRHRL